MTQDLDVKDFLVQSGLIVGNAIRTSGGTYYPVNTNITSPNNDFAAALFEMMVQWRKPSMLRVFSIGPTQMWLGQTYMSVDYVESVRGTVSPAGRVASFPQTWDAIWDLYASTSVKNIVGYLSYLRSSRLPGEPSLIGDAQVAINYLASRQTGTAAANDYYNRFFRDNLAACSQWWGALPREGTDLLIA
jgi:hypothetical protein